MKILQNPIRTTILYGLICGFTFIPVSFAFNYMFMGSRGIFLTIFLFVAGYTLFLSRWSRKPVLTSAFPLLLLFLAVFLADSPVVFYLLALVVISWIRSAICFRNSFGSRLAVESLICIAAGVVIAVFTPASASAWALAAWMLFLIQSLYFVIFDHGAEGLEDQYDPDPFERASRQAEAILSLISI